MGTTSIAIAQEFDLQQHNDYIQYINDRGNISDSEIIGTVEKGTQSLLAIIVDVGFDILALLFVMGVIAFAAGSTMKNGQWLKWSSGIMMGTFISIIALRIAPILVLTIDKIGITLIINHIVELLASVGYYMAIIMLLVGLFLRSLNKVFEHPKYFRWGRTLLTGCVIIVVLSYISPVVIANL
ncbi:hypothetical protein [Virgibacillus halodenitrificans]|uniref:hypothetical protein n=1 Tax=Virgibacillus halodenitrificans TaxID=1482 RepID=UPI0013CEDE3A|nr:hypothetical protein [Virgibacillus halodenitrificans]